MCNKRAQGETVLNALPLEVACGAASGAPGARCGASSDVACSEERRGSRAHAAGSRVNSSAGEDESSPVEAPSSSSSARRLSAE